MADTKISNLTALAEAPSTADLLAIVDVTANETKKLTVANLIDAVEANALTFTASVAVDNLKLDGNTLSSTSGQVAVTPLAGEDFDVNLTTGIVNITGGTPTIRLTNNSYNNSPDWDNTVVGDLDFYSIDTTSGYSASTVARVRAVGNVASGNAPLSDLAFWTGSGNTGDVANQVLSEKMRLLYSGNLLVGTTTNSGQLTVNQSDTDGAEPVLSLTQADLSEEMIEFDTTVGAGNPVDTAAIGTYYGKVRVNVAGVGYKFIALYNT